jgi:hypothetical protein
MINKGLFVLIMSVALLMACKGQQQPSTEPDVQESVEKLMSIDEICKVEDIIADSSLMEAAGDSAWRKVNDHLIRVKIGSTYYLRQESKNGTITNITYRYD